MLSHFVYFIIFYLAFYEDHTFIYSSSLRLNDCTLKTRRDSIHNADITPRLIQTVMSNTFKPQIEVTDKNVHTKDICKNL